MEEKSVTTTTKSEGMNRETEVLSEHMVEADHEEEVEEEGTGDEVESEGEGGVVSGGGSGKGREVVMSGKRRKRSPRRFNFVNEPLLSPVPVSCYMPAPLSQSYVKRGRGRPRGSGSLQLLSSSLSGIPLETVGGSFTPHILYFQTGEDMSARITAFAYKSSRAVSILNGSGVVTRVIIRHAFSSHVVYEGLFDILSLRGSYLYDETSGEGSQKRGMISISLAKSDGRVFGGSLAGSLIAAGPSHVILATFKQNISKELKKMQAAEAASAMNYPGNSDQLVNVPIQFAQMNAVDLQYRSTPTSALMEPTYEGHPSNANIVLNPNPNPNLNHASPHPLRSVEASRLLGHVVPNQSTSP